MKHLFYILIAMASLLAPVTTSAEHMPLAHYRNAMVMLGFESEDVTQAMRTFGMDDDAIESYYNEFAYWAGKLFQGAPIPYADSMDYYEPLFIMFNRECCWTFSTSCIRTDLEMHNAINNVLDNGLNNYLGYMCMLRNMLTNKYMVQLESQKGEDVYFGQNLPTKQYRNKLAMFLYGNGEFDAMYNEIYETVTEDLGLEDSGELDTYFYRDEFILRQACVYNRFLTEPEIDELDALYSTKQGERLKTLYQVFMQLLNDISEGKTSDYSTQLQNNEDIKILFALNSPVMAKYQAVYPILHYCAERIVVSDIENIYPDLQQGSIVKIFNGTDYQKYIDAIDKDLEDLCNRHNP